MKSKKILLPESPLAERQKARPKKSSTNSGPSRTRKSKTRPLPFMVDARQRNEAIGLVMVGFSAFIFSLLHYLSGSKISGLINASMVYLGIGVYIVPLLIGLMGIQRFLERPFQNLPWRIAGSLGVMTFGLGLLGLEGGKVGVYTLRLFTAFFGVIPSKILFTFLVLASLIFALDILYKDVLAAGLVCASLTTKLLIFCWEVLLSLCSMMINAVKTTGSLISAIFGRVKQVYEDNDIDPAAQIGKLLSFSPKPQTVEGLEVDEEDLIDESKVEINTKASTPTSVITEEEEATVIPMPQIWQGASQAEEEKDESQASAATIPLTGSSVISVQVSNISPMTLAETGIPSFDAGNTTPPPHQTEEDYSAFEGIQEDDSSDFDVDYEEDEMEVVVHLEDSIVQREDNDEDQEPDAVYLEDNRIDLEIKNDELENSTEYKNPYAESKLPPLSLLKIAPPRDSSQAQSDLSLSSSLLLKTLEDFGIKASITAVVEGPAISRFELKPAPGVKVSRITTLVDDIALALAAQSIRIEAPIPGKPALGIEIPNAHPTPVYFYDLLKHDKFLTKKTSLNLALGVTINGKPVFADLTEMPHLLIAGSTGSGKSVCVNTIIASILYQARADQVKFVMIDPKMVELSSYNGIPHLISPVVTDPAKASAALMWAVEEMERRYELLACCGVRKISTYNEDLERLRKEFDSQLEPMPFIVIIIDELADLMMTASAEVEGSICRLAQMARAVGIHLIIATQRPSVNVLTGLIKANLPSRIAFSVTSAIDSRTILDAKGAERLLGKGDMLFVPKGRNKPLRIQGAFISDRELMDITEYVKSQGQPEYMDIAPDKVDEDEDDNDDELDKTASADEKLMASIVKYLETQEKTSTSMLQRKFRIGYNRAARIMDMLEETGMVGPSDGSNKRRVLCGRSNSQI